MRYSLHGTTVLWYILTILLVAAPNAAAQEKTASVQTPAPLRYRRVFTPQTDLDKFTRGYRLIPRGKFPELLERVEKRQRQARKDTTWIESADYSAVFADGQLTSGLAQLKVVQTADEASILALSPCQLALGTATWRGPETAEDAIMGNDLAGNLVALVRDSGQLQFHWTLHGETNQWDETSFDVVLAPAPMNRFSVELPSGYQLLSNRGIVTRLDRDSGDGSEDALHPAHKWMVQLGGTHQFRLIVASQKAMRQRKQLVSLQQDTLYRLTDDGLEVDCNVAIEIQREPLEVLLFRVDAELQVTSVRLGNREIKWSLESEPDGRSRQLEVRFAEPLSGIHRTLKVSALGPLRTDSTWRLPRLHCEETFWRQGTMTLLIPSSLGLRHLAAIDARQSKPGTSAAASSLATRRFDLFSDEGCLEVDIVRNTPRLSGAIGTTIHLETGTMTALIVAKLSCTAGEHYLLEADIPNIWTLDGIESEPANFLDDHQFVAYEAGHKRLQIRLAQPLTAAAPLRLSIRAHRTPTLDLRADDFRPVMFRNLAQLTRLVAIAPTPSFHLNLSGDAGVTRQDPDALSSAEADLLQPRSGGIVFFDGQQADFMTVKVTREDPTFTAENHVSVETTADSMTESYRLVCTPESTSINRVLVLLSEARPDPITWSLLADGNKLLSATMLPRPAGQEDPYNQADQVWELLLRNPQDKPFEIHGTRTTPFLAAKQIGLATLPDATSQEGWLTILSLDGSTLSIKASSAKPIPNAPPEPEQCSSARASYRYDVSRNARVLINHVRPRSAQAPLWAWCCRIRSQLLANGEMTHQATYLLESAGGSEFHFRLPENGALLSVEIDGAPVARHLHSEANGSHTVTLPANARFPRVTVAYSTPRKSFRVLRRITTQLPAVDIPLLDQQWTLWLAPGLSPIHDAQAGLGATWSQRLLGPWAAAPSERPFQFFSAEQWKMFVNRNAATRSASAVGQRFLQLLGEQYATPPAQSSAKSLTWRVLLEGYQQRAAETDEAPSVWVDTVSLRASGFTLELAIDKPMKATPAQVAAELLLGEQLVIVAYNDILMLTSLDSLARWPASIRTTPDPSIVTVVARSPLARELESLATWPADDIIPLSAWIALPALAEAPWYSDHGISRLGVAGRSWHAHEIELNRDGQGQTVVLQRDTLAAFGWAILLLTTGLVSWFGSYRPRLLLPMLSSAAMLAMLVPEAWIPLTANLFMGIVLAGCLLAIRHLIVGKSMYAEPPIQGDATQGDAVRGNTTRGDTATGVAATVGVLLLATLLIFAAQSLWADDPVPGDPVPGGPIPGDPVPGDSSGEGSPIYDVIVPIDKELKPVGDYDYVPSELYDILYQRVDESASTPQHWLVRHATYHATFTWTRQHSSIDLTSLTALYQLELFRPGQRISFPWRGDDPAVQILEARLAGQPIELVWNNERTAFFITVPDQGVTRLEFVLLPTTTDEAGTRELKFSIPSLSRAQLRIETPFDAPDIEVMAAVGEAGIVAEAGERLVELGPVKSLGMRWGSNQEQRGGPQKLDVQQLNWLKIRPKDHPDSVILDTIFRIQYSGDRLQQISLRVDPQLRLLPLTADQSVEIETNEVRDGSPVSLIVRWRQPVEQDFPLHLQFLVVNTAGLGDLSLPRLEVVDARVARQWLAVSVASDLDFASGMSEMLTPMDAAEFLTAWGEAELAPNICYRMEADDPVWSITTRPRQPRSEAQQRLDISVGPDSMKLVLNADVDTTQGTVFQHEFLVPESFRVAGVSVTVDGKPIPAEVEHDGSGALTLFLGSGVSGSHHIELRGEQDVPAIGTDFPVPNVTLRNMAAIHRYVRLFRQVNVLVSVNIPVPNKLRQRVGEGQFHNVFGRLVAEFSAHEEREDDRQKVTIRILPNQPLVVARLVTKLLRIDDTWEAIADYEAWVTNAPAGVVDQIRFEIPEEWAEPFTIEPAMPYEIRPIPGQRQHLILRPTKPLTDRFQVSIRGTLALGSNERGRAPNIVPLDVNRVERFLVLPTQLDQQRIDWKTSGLRLVALRDALPNGRSDARGLVAYAVYSRPRAVIADVQRVAGKRQIDLADVQLICHADGGCFGTVSFDLEPAGAGSCTLEIPDHCELIQATVEGVPAALVPLADHRWHLRLASEQLPQQLVVLFRIRRANPLTSAATQFQVPSITDFEVVRTLWTIHGPPGIVLDSDDAAQHRVSAIDQDAVRLQTTASLVESAVETVMDSRAAEIVAWYTPWAIRLARVDARLARDRQLADTPLPISPAEVEEIFRQQEIIGQRLNVPSTVDDFRRQTVRYTQPSDMRRFVQRQRQHSQFYVFTGAVQTVVIANAAQRRQDGWWQALGAALAALLGGLTWLASRNARMVGWLCQWPFALGVLAGLAWWLFASPSLLGWVIIAASLWGAVRLPVPSQRVEDASHAPTADTAS